MRLTETITDGPITAPRVVHHVVKIATGAVVLLVISAAIAYLPILAAACLLSLGWFATLRVSYALDHGTPLVSRDLGCDLALHVLPIAFVLPSRLWAPVLAAACLATYAVTVDGANP